MKTWKLKTNGSNGSTIGPRSAHNRKGFSLVELLVVIAIISVMSVGTVVGFGAVAQTMRLKGMVGFSGDIVERTELEVLRGDYSKATIHFLVNYLAIEQELDDSTLDLHFTSPCTLTAGNAGNLITQDQDGRTIAAKSVLTNDAVDCDADFISGLEREWQYQLTSGSERSNIVRLVHFNINRENADNPTSISSGTPARIEISAPYAKKDFYQTDSLVSTFDLTFEDTQANQETLTIE